MSNMQNKVTFQNLVNHIKNIIISKDELNRDTTGIDHEVMAYISVYEHGAKEYSKNARERLIQFACDADLIRNKSQVAKD